MPAISAAPFDTPAHDPPAATPVADLITAIALALGAVVAPLAAVSFRAFDLDRFLVPKELTLHATAVIAGLVALAGLRRVRVTGWDTALVAWLALSFASAVFATNHWVAARALALTGSSAVVFWAARRAGAAGYGRLIAAALALGVTAAVATSLAQAYGVHADVFALNRAPGGTMGNRNFVAHIAAAGLPLLLWLGITARGALVYAASGAALLASSAVLVLSRTRAAWLALAVWGVIILLLAWRGPPLFVEPTFRRRARTAVIATMVGVIGALALPNTLDWRSDSPYLDSVRGVVNFSQGSGAGRLRQWAHSLEIVRAAPIVGVGPGNWPVAYPLFAPPNDPSLEEGTGMTANPWPSSDWVAAASERGVAAALAFALVVALLLVGALRARYDAALTPDARLAALAGGSVLMIAALEGAFDAVFLLATPALLAWVAAGALLPTPRTASEVIVAPGRRRLAMAALAIIGAAVLLMTAGRLEAMRLYAKGTLVALEEASRHDPGSYRIHQRAADSYLARGNCQAARPHAEAASKLFPKAFAPRNVLSRCGGR